MTPRHPYPCHRQYQYPSRSSLPLLAVLITLALSAAWTPAAAAWDVRDDAPAGQFRLFHQAFATGLYAPPRHSAVPLGWVGFDVYADVSVLPDFGGSDFADSVLRGSLPGDALAVTRIGARKGLPLNLNVGLSYGQVVDSDLEVLTADVQWSLLEGSAVLPAVAVRASYSDLSGSDAFDLQQLGVDLYVSKGFAVVSAFGGASLIRSESTLNRRFGDTLSEESTDEIFFAGVAFNLLAAKLTATVEQGDELKGVFRVSLGLN